MMLYWMAAKPKAEFFSLNTLCKNGKGEEAINPFESFMAVY